MRMIFVFHMISITNAVKNVVMIMTQMTTTPVVEKEKLVPFLSEVRFIWTSSCGLT